MADGLEGCSMVSVWAFQVGADVSLEDLGQRLNMVRTEWLGYEDGL